MINDSAGSSDKHVWPLSQEYGLLHHVNATHQHAGLQANPGSQRLERLRDLDGQFASWGNDESEEGLYILEESLYDGNRERSRFARARLRQANDILTCVQFIVCS